ncbi:hypothetical protein MICAG_1000019 [Microcystis aeruginosa PCC 9808]|uniref:Uncharacterized protein n=1 Tax=Microcystis aeruginosa PCC 9808 TaxID=1160284 RepID=I4HFD9_MICAE|nr:hypothetical protein MICAG_1000019 [Microcystis aeruginosa PCC 9808]
MFYLYCVNRYIPTLSQLVKSVDYYYLKKLEWGYFEQAVAVVKVYIILNYI